MTYTPVFARLLTACCHDGFSMKPSTLPLLSVFMSPYSLGSSASVAAIVILAPLAL